MNNFSKILIITVLLSINAFSQKLSEMRVVGNAEFLSSELIDKNIKDANGETCAGLIIQSDLTGLNYTSYNGIVKINKNAGKDFLFLSADERVVEVFCDGFASLKIILNDYGIKLESGKVWQIKITGEKKNIVNLIPVNFLIEPFGAEIFINGESKGIEPGQKLPAGDYTLRIEKKGYKPINEKIKISADNNLFKYNLKAIDLIPVTIKSIPDQAQITLDNLDIGLTNNGYFLYPGTYKLKIIKSGYLDIERTIVITEQGTNEFKDSLVKNTGTLSIMVIPNNSEIFINKIKRANLPGNIELAPGKYKIEIRKEDYYPKEEIIEIKQGEIAARNCKLEEIMGNALIKITPIEAKCNLVKNGKVIDSWVGLKNLKNIQTGSYALEAKMPGYKTLKKEIKIQENQTTTIELIMEKGEDNSVVQKDGFGCRVGCFANLAKWETSDEDDSRWFGGLTGVLTAGYDFDLLYVGLGPGFDVNSYQQNNTFGNYYQPISVTTSGVTFNLTFGIEDLFFLFGTGSSAFSGGYINLSKASFIRFMFGWGSTVGIAFSYVSYPKLGDYLQRVEINFGLTLK